MRAERMDGLATALSFMAGSSPAMIAFKHGK